MNSGRSASLPSATSNGQELATCRQFAVTGSLVVLATGSTWMCQKYLYQPDIAIIYLYVIVGCSMLFGWWHAILASVFSVLAFDFFFVEPIFEFNLGDLHYLFTFSMMFGVGLLVARLASRIRHRQSEAFERDARSAAANSLSHLLALAVDEVQAREILVHHTAEAFRAHSALFVPNTDGVVRIAANVGKSTNVPEEQSVASWVYENKSLAARATCVQPNARILCVPLRASGKALGALTVELPPIALDAAAGFELLESFARQGAVCISGLRAAEQAKAAELRFRAESTRNTLLGAVSHDIRTPLAAINSAATMLRDDEELLTLLQKREMFETICDEVERVDRMVANLLHMTRLESGEMQPQMCWVSCEELVGAALHMVRTKIGSLTIRTALPKSLPFVRADQSLMEQLFANLFENIANHAGAKATVDIKACQVEDEMRIEVADDGPGFPIGDERRIFDKFFRASAKAAHGTGLGLAICRVISELHNGTISAENRPTGGALFLVTLPLVGCPPSIPAELDCEQVDE